MLYSRSLRGNVNSSITFVPVMQNTYEQIGLGLLSFLFNSVEIVWLYPRIMSFHFLELYFFTQLKQNLRQKLSRQSPVSVQSAMDQSTLPPPASYPVPSLPS